MYQRKPRRSYEPEPGAVAAEITAGTSRYPDVYFTHQPDRITGLETVEPGIFDVQTTGRVRWRIEVWSDRCWRFRYNLDELKRLPAYALAEDFVRKAPELKVGENRQYYTIQSDSLLCRIAKKDGTLRLTERAGGRVVWEERDPFRVRTTLLRGTDQLRIQVAAAPGEKYFGLGDKSWESDLRGREFQNWCTDAFGFDRDMDPLYRSIPFFYGLREDLAYGVFLNNTWRTWFDFASYDDDLVNIWSEGGEFDYFFCYGPELDAVAAQYHRMTGLPELPPLWALGFHQCRWSYYPESRVRELAAEFREREIPCDAIYLDIDYMDGYRCFTWNEEHFPDPQGLIADLRKQDFQTVVMIDPGIRVDPDYFVYAEGVEQDVFCRRTTGEPMVGPVWPPACVWPDFTNPAVRQWWGPLYRELYLEQGVSGFWNDMNEPAMFKTNNMTFPDAVRHDYDGHPCDHRQAHNVYGQLMARASYEGLKALQPAKRPFLLTRAGFSGGQRYAAVWTGDNVASWEHLRLANIQCQRLSISGYSFCGTDIGGFVDVPTGELLLRWLQLGVFHPFFRIHSMGNNVDGAAEAEAEMVKESERLNRLDQEPWAFGAKWTEYNTAAIRFRYHLLAHLYTVFRKHLETGLPILRPLAFYDQKDARCRERKDEFLFGADLLVSPILKPGQKSKTIYLPEGKWYDFYTGRAYPGGQALRTRVRLDRIPVFVRAGAIIPYFPEAAQHTGALPGTRLDLRVYAAATGEGHFYWDAGEGYGYEVGQYQELTLVQTTGRGSWALQLLREGAFRSSLEELAITVYGLESPPETVRVDGAPTPDFTWKSGQLHVTVPISTERIECD
jgi:alpha-glucosidase